MRKRVDVSMSDSSGWGNVPSMQYWVIAIAKSWEETASLVLAMNSPIAGKVLLSPKMERIFSLSWDWQNQISSP